MLANEMNEASMSSTISSQDSHVISAVECRKVTHKESSPPNIFNNSSGLKYLHKKFKRVASTVIEDICDKVKTNAYINQTPVYSASKDSDASVRHNSNGEAPAASSNAVAVSVQSHINESEKNSQDIVAKCIQCRKSLEEQQHKFCNECNPELINASAKYGHGVLRNEFSSKQNVSGSNTRGDGTAMVAVQPAHKQYETKFLDSLNTCKNVRSPKPMDWLDLPLQQKTNYKFDPYAEDFRTKTNLIADSVPQNFKENLLRGAHNLSAQTLNASTSPKNVESISACTSNKSPVRRKHLDRPNSCVTCGVECKNRSLLYKHCRLVSEQMQHFSKCFTFGIVIFILIFLFLFVSSDFKEYKP